MMTRFEASLELLLLAIILVHVVPLPTTSTDALPKWSQHRLTNLSGDIILGALFPVHERNGSYDCGKIQDEGILQLESLLYTLQKINNDSQILPGVKLGLLALDSCDSTAYSLEQSLNFVKGFIARNNANSNQDKQFTCDDGSIPKYRNGSFDRVVGVIGGQTSAVSIQLANLLRLFKVPQISYQSTSPTLSDKEKFEYFFRTVPSDVNQALAIMEILKTFHWTYVSVVYSDTEYGNKGYDKLLETAARYNICLTNPQSINTDSHKDSDYDTVIQNLMHKSNARVVVVFADKQTARGLMSAAKRLKAIRRFVWIGSDAWSGQASVVQGNEQVAEGAITVSHMVQQLKGFDHYLASLTPEHSSLNPWFTEYWETVFKCRITNMPSAPYNKGLDKWCNQNLKIQVGKNTQSPPLHFVRDAAYAFAHALHDLQATRCKNASGLCDAMKNINGVDLKMKLNLVSFKDESGQDFRFSPQGDAPPRYSILNYQSIDSGKYEWKRVGNYTLHDNEARLIIEKELLRFKRTEEEFPQSFCSEPCRLGQAKLKLEGDTCCWLCTNCTQYQFLPDEFHCQDCPLGTLPNAVKTNCVPIPEAYLSYGNGWAIGTMSFAGLGIAVVAFVSLVFRAYSDTPIIKASGRELSYLLLTGIFLSFCMTFIIVAKPSSWTCGLTRFFLGFCYTLCYAAIVTKTNRIARIFSQRRKRPCHRPKYTSPKSQLVITALLVSVQVVINATWLLYDPPGVNHVFPTREENVLVCLGSDNASYLVGLVYPSILIGFCTVYAFKTRKCPDGFNEARYLTFTNYTTCVIWLAFLPLFVLSTSNTIRSVTLSFLLNLSGAVQIACLFMPKVYIALFKPEKNTKESVMCHHHRSNCAQNSSSCTTPNIYVNGGCSNEVHLNNETKEAEKAAVPSSPTSTNTHQSTSTALTNIYLLVPDTKNGQQASTTISHRNNIAQSKTL